MLQPVVSEQASNVSIVFLLHVGLVVFEVGPGPGFPDAVIFQPVVNVVVEELSSVIAVHSQQLEGLAFMNRFQSLETRMLAPVPYGPRLRPTAGYINTGQRPDKASSHVTSTVGCGVDFRPTGLRRVPVFGADLHQGFHSRCWLGRSRFFPIEF